MSYAPEEVVSTGRKAIDWLKKHWIKIHVSALLTGWGVFEWLAPRAADAVHKFVLHIFWGGFVHKLLHIAS